jgi:hypothetical protein
MSNMATLVPDAMKALLALGTSAGKGGVPARTLLLIQLRASGSARRRPCRSGAPFNPCSPDKSRLGRTMRSAASASGVIAKNSVAFAPAPIPAKESGPDTRLALPSL